MGKHAVGEELLVVLEGCGARKREYGGLSWKGLRWGSERGSLRPDTRRPHLAPQPWRCPPPPELFAGLSFPVRSPALHSTRAPALNTLRTGSPRPISLAAPSPETTSASLGPTVWQLPMAPTRGRALGDRRDLDSSRQPTPRTRPHCRPRPAYSATPSGCPPAPLPVRRPAGSVAAEGGAGTSRRSNWREPR